MPAAGKWARRSGKATWTTVTSRKTTKVVALATNRTTPGRTAGSEPCRAELEVPVVPANPAMRTPVSGRWIIHTCGTYVSLGLRQQQRPPRELRRTVVDRD